MKQNTLQANISDDHKKIIGFWSSNFPEWPVEKYAWFYEGNPAGKAGCWLTVSDDDDSIVGTVALFPRVVYVNGVKNNAGIVGDFIMVREQRNFWLAFGLQKKVIAAVETGAVDFVYGSPNKNADQLMSRTGHRIVGTSASYKKIIRTYNYLYSRIHSKLVCRVVSVCLDIVLRMFSRETYSRAQERDNLSVQICTTFDERIDRFFEKCRTQYTIIGERNAKFLNWRFNQCPYVEYKTILMTNRATDEVCGYIVYRVEDGALTIADLLLEDFDKYGDVLFIFLLKHARKSGVGSLACSFVGPDELKNKLRRFGFMDMKEDRSFTVYSNADSIDTDILYNFENWYFMEADNDI